MSMGRLFSSYSGPVALTAATPRTLIQIRGTANARARLVGFGFSFDGAVTTSTPAYVRVARQTSDGTFTAGPEVLWDIAEPAGACSCYYAATSTEPTYATPADVLWEGYVHPQGGGRDIQFPLGREPLIAAANTNRIGLAATVTANVNGIGYFIWEE